MLVVSGVMLRKVGTQTNIKLTSVKSIVDQIENIIRMLL